jgi:cytochrome c-type biogenesis protein CcmE
MTAATPVGRRKPWRLLTLAVVVLAAVGVLAATGLQGSLVYYKTTSELVADPGLQGERLRLGGLVAPSSVSRGPNGVSFVLTDGVQEVRVVNSDSPRGVFTEGQGALVEGVLGADGVFRSDLLLVKHGNEYRAPDEAGNAPPVREVSP